MALKQVTDVQITRYRGGLALVRPLTDRARAWISRETDAGAHEPLRQHGGSYPIDLEYVDEVIRGLQADGLNVKESTK